jgi:hypothetical protein
MSSTYSKEDNRVRPADGPSAGQQPTVEFLQKGRPVTIVDGIQAHRTRTGEMVLVIIDKQDL